MRISGEGKIGLGLALVFGLGTGAVAVWPDQKIIGEVVMAFSFLGLLALAVHHWWGLTPNLYWGRVPLQKAATRAFEVTEGSLYGELNGSPKMSETERMTLVIGGFLTHHMEMWAKLPPSTKPRRISEDQMASLRWIPGEDALRSAYAVETGRYVDVTVSRRSLGRHLAFLRRLANYKL